MNTKALTAIALLSIAAGVIHARPMSDARPLRRPLQSIPMELQGLNAQDIDIPQETRTVLGEGEFLNRNYVGESGSASVGLFLAYFPTQRTGQAIHSPQNCLPGAGWTFDSSKPLTFTDSAGTPHSVGEYLITNGTYHQLVLYWYRSADQDVVGDFHAKALLMYDALRRNRTDGALIRISTPFLNSTDLPSAEQRAIAFAAQLTPVLRQTFPD